MAIDGHLSRTVLWNSAVILVKIGLLLKIKNWSSPKPPKKD